MNHVDELSLAGVIGKLHPLPSPRGAALEMLRLSQAENTSVREIAHVAQADPALAARLIHAANNVARGSAPQTASVGAAVLRLGLTASRQIALGFSLVNEHRQGACKQFHYKEFWTASLLRGLAAQAIAERLGTGDPQEALACGLLAEIGRLALATARPAAYGELLAEHGSQGVKLRSAEHDRFGIDHGTLGCALLGMWNTPTRLVAPIDGYFAPPIYVDGVNRQVRRMTWTLVLAEAVARAATAPQGRQDAWTHLAIDAATNLDADTDVLDAVAREIAVQLPSWAPLLDLPVPEFSPPDFPGYAQKGTAARESGTGLRILLVEDDESERVLCQIALEKEGHRVRLAADGEEALQEITAHPPQVVITDIDMPRLNGLALCSMLRASTLWTPLYVIVLTGRERHEDLVECIHAGANDFVAKSAEPSVLLARLQAAAHSVRSSEDLMQSADTARNLATELAIERSKSKFNIRSAPGTP
jgi:two-component system cell cycle response regulator